MSESEYRELLRRIVEITDAPVRDRDDASLADIEARAAAQEADKPPCDDPEEKS